MACANIPRSHTYPILPASMPKNSARAANNQQQGDRQRRRRTKGPETGASTTEGGVPTDIPICPICQDAVWPCQLIHLSFCNPVQHILHYECWWDQTEYQQSRCSICRQPEVPRHIAVNIYYRFPTRERLICFDELCGDSAIEWFSLTGQGLIRDFVSGEITESELLRVVRAKRPRPNVDIAINTFIKQHAPSAGDGRT